MLGENLPRRVWNRQTKFTSLASCICERKVFKHKPTHLATGVVCHPDSEQNRPHKIPRSCRGLNRGPTASENFTSVPHYSTTPQNGVDTSKTAKLKKKKKILVQVWSAGAKYV